VRLGKGRGVKVGEVEAEPLNDFLAFGGFLATSGSAQMVVGASDDSFGLGCITGASPLADSSMGAVMPLLCLLEGTSGKLFLAALFLALVFFGSGGRTDVLIVNFVSLSNETALQHFDELDLRFVGVTSEEHLACGDLAFGDCDFEARGKKFVMVVETRDLAALSVGGMTGPLPFTVVSSLDSSFLGDIFAIEGGTRVDESRAMVIEFFSAASISTSGGAFVTNEPMVLVLPASLITSKTFLQELDASTEDFTWEGSIQNK
jgi:hypothetical protein